MTIHVLGVLYVSSLDSSNKSLVLLPPSTSILYGILIFLHPRESLRRRRRRKKKKKKKNKKM